MSFHILVLRDSFTLKSTVGKIYFNGQYFGYCLEDVSRGENVKIPGETCIPEGTYKVKSSMSRRFKRVMPMIYNQSNGYELIAKGISFKGLRYHGGNRSKDTHGCILIAKNKIDNDTIQGSLEKELTALIGDKEGWVTIVNS